jgi:membrane protein
MTETRDRGGRPGHPAGDEDRSPPLAGFFALPRRTVEAFLEDDVSHWGAALAYYALISLAPLVVLGVTLLGRLGATAEAEAWILDQVRILAGPRAMDVVGTILEETGQFQMGSGGAVVTVAVLLFGATAVFANLQGVLNRIWGVKPEGPFLKELVRTRVAAFLMVLSLGVILVVSAAAGTVLSWLGPLLDPLESALPFVHLAELFASVLLLWLFVTATFVILPAVDIHWRDVWVGSLATAGLLYVGKYCFSAFLARNAFASLYGAAGSLFLGLMWIYFSAQAFFLGAEFTQVWAHRQGRLIRPEGHAVRTKVVEAGENGGER